MQRYLDIINHFGYRKQMKKLNEECYEFLEAVDIYEDAWLEQDDKEPYYTVGEMAIFRDHIIEEMGDMLILLTEFIAKYDIEKEELDKVMDFKLDRTEQRIVTKYYEKN